MMWKRFNIYEGVIVINFILNIIFYNLNEDYLQIIPKDIASYIFWLSMGLCIGFEICKYEVKRTLKKDPMR